jgi:symplekin
VEVEKGFNRLAASSLRGHDREGWLTLLTRLATRSSFRPETVSGATPEYNGSITRKDDRAFDISNGIRQALMNYIMENFRARIDVAIMWLSEEWYSERVAQSNDNSLTTYWHWTIRLFDAMTTYFDIRDGKILIRFLSEVPAINRDMLRLTKKIAEDPDRVQLTVNALLYLIMFRPPVREAAIDTVAELWQENQDAKPAAAKILARYRPAVVENAKQTSVKEEA